MDTYNIIRGVAKKDSKLLLTSKIEKELEEIKSEMDRLDNECKKYDNIIAILDRLPTELGWSLPFLPVTKHAMLPNAMLTNTNEVQVHIGDGWFTRCSAHHAKGICRRRQEKCGATKNTLKERADMLQEWLRVALGQDGISGGHQDQAADSEDETVGPEDAFGANEITEFISEEQYLAEKVAHKERVREHYLKQRAEFKKQQELTDVELWRRLEELELQEYCEGELKVDRLEQLRLEREQQLEQELADEGPQISSSTIKLGWSWDDGSESDDTSSSGNTSPAEVTSPTESTQRVEVKEKPRKLSFAEHIETGSDETSVIEFSHTPTGTPSCKPTFDGKIQSPSDIYTAYHELFSPANTKPKSILKRRSRDETELVSPAAQSCSPEPARVDSPTQQSPEELQEVLLDIIEKQPVAPIHTPQVPEKKMSKFKSARMASRKS